MPKISKKVCAQCDLSIRSKGPSTTCGGCKATYHTKCYKLEPCCNLCRECGQKPPTHPVPRDNTEKAIACEDCWFKMWCDLCNSRLCDAPYSDEDEDDDPNPDEKLKMELEGLYDNCNACGEVMHAYCVAQEGFGAWHCNGGDEYDE